jgi:hypothetical protein
VCAAGTNAGIAILRAELQPTLALCGLPRLATFASGELGGGEDLLGMAGGGGDDEEAPEREARSASVLMVGGTKLIGSTFTIPGAQLAHVPTDDAKAKERPTTTGKGLPTRLQASGLAPPLDVHVSERCGARTPVAPSAPL